MESFVFKSITSVPQEGHTIAIYEAGTTNHITGLTDLSGNSFDSPYTVPAAYTEWGFVPSDSKAYDVYWVDGGVYLTKNQVPVTNDSLYVYELSADPADPAEGSFVLWQSDGTETGDDGDIIIKITAGGVTKTHTLVDFSAI